MNYNAADFVSALADSTHASVDKRIGEVVAAISNSINKQLEDQVWLFFLELYSDPSYVSGTITKFTHALAHYQDNVYVENGKLYFCRRMLVVPKEETDCGPWETAKDLYPSKELLAVVNLAGGAS